MRNLFLILFLISCSGYKSEQNINPAKQETLTNKKIIENLKKTDVFLYHCTLELYDYNGLSLVDLIYHTNYKTLYVSQIDHSEKDALRLISTTVLPSFAPLKKKDFSLNYSNSRVDGLNFKEGKKEIGFPNFEKKIISTFCTEDY